MWISSQLGTEKHWTSNNLGRSLRSPQYSLESVDSNDKKLTPKEEHATLFGSSIQVNQYLFSLIQKLYKPRRSLGGVTSQAY